MLTALICACWPARSWFHSCPNAVLLALLGGPICAFALSQACGQDLTLPVAAAAARGNGSVALSAGFMAGCRVSGGPPVIAYLIAVDIGKRDMVRILGVVFLVGAVAMVGGHAASGVLTWQTLAFSAVLVAPSLLGLGLGYRVQDRLDAARFRRWTLGDDGALGAEPAAAGVRLVTEKGPRGGGPRFGCRRRYSASTRALPCS